MTDWLPIGTLPDEMKDGRQVWVKRVYQRKVVAEGCAVFGVCHLDAPQRKPLGPDPLGRLSSEDYAREARDTALYADKPKWLKPDRMYSFPTPTHWSPTSPEVGQAPKEEGRVNG